MWITTGQDKIVSIQFNSILYNRTYTILNKLIECHSLGDYVNLNNHLTFFIKAVVMKRHRKVVAKIRAVTWIILQ